MSSMFPTFDIASSALTTHRIWMNALADNIANINTVKPMSQPAYQEKFIVAQEIPSAPGRPGRRRRRRRSRSRCSTATRPAWSRYDPTNPLADKHGPRAPAVGEPRRPDDEPDHRPARLPAESRGHRPRQDVVSASPRHQRTVAMAVTPISGLMSAAGVGSIAPVTPSTHRGRRRGATRPAASATRSRRRSTRCRERRDAADSLAQAGGDRQPHRHPQLHDRRDRGVAHHRAHRRSARPRR